MAGLIRGENTKRETVHIAYIGYQCQLIKMLPEEAIVSATDLRRTYFLGEPVQALDGIYLSLSTGSYTAVMDPSGSGKSTPMNVSGLLLQQRGWQTRTARTRPSDRARRALSTSIQHRGTARTSA